MRLDKSLDRKPAILHEGDALLKAMRVLEMEEQGYKVTAACEKVGISRPNFYIYRERARQALEHKTEAEAASTAPPCATDDEIGEVESTCRGEAGPISAELPNDEKN